MKYINPYIAGNPIYGNDFTGRKQELEKVSRSLLNGNSIILSGSRRSGKTSFLLQLRKSLTQNCNVIYFDLQDKARLPLDVVLSDLAESIISELNLPNIMIPDTKISDYFIKNILPKAIEYSNSKPIVFLFDEFDVFDEQILNSSQEASRVSVFPFLRHCVQTFSDLRFVFALGRNIQDLSSIAVSLFKSFVSVHLSPNMSFEDTVEIIKKAERNGLLLYEDDAIEEVYHLTNGHYYLTQALCSAILENALNEDVPKLPVSIQKIDVSNSISTTLSMTEHALFWIWSGLPPAERVFASALATIEIGNSDDVIAEFGRNNIRVVYRELMHASDLLSEYDIIVQEKEIFKFSTELFRLWINSNYPLSRVKEEVDRINPASDALYAASVAYADMGKIAESIDLLEQSLTLNPAHFRARLKIGEMYLLKGDFEAAIKHLEDAYNYDAVEARFALLRALEVYSGSLEKMEKNEDALTVYKRILELNPQDTVATRKFEQIKSKTLRKTDEIFKSDTLSNPLDAPVQGGVSPINPFIYGRPLTPSEFLGHKSETRTIISRLINGESTAVVGDPHSGKTSLLTYLASPNVRSEWLANDSSNYVFSLVDCHLMPDKFTPADFWKRALKPLEEIPERVDLYRQRQFVENSGFDLETLLSLFQLLADAGTHLVLLIDEFEVLIHHPNFKSAQFFGGLRALSSRSGGLHLITASRIDVSRMNEFSREISPYGSGLFNYLAEVLVQPLTQLEVEKLFSIAQTKSHFTLSPKDLLYVKILGGNHPFRLQVAGSALYDAILDRQDEEDYYEIANNLYYQRSAYHYDEVWGNLDKNTQTVLLMLSLAELGGYALGKNFTFGDIEKVKNFKPELNKLARIGLAEKVGDGWQFDKNRFLVWQGESWRLTSQGFLWWVTDVVLSETRKVPKYDEWLFNHEYVGLLTKGQWEQLKDWGSKIPTGVGGIMKKFVQELIKVPLPNG